MYSAAKQVGLALALVIAAYVMHGFYVYWDSRTAPPSRAPSVERAPQPGAPAAAPTAPWAGNYDRLRRQEYAALVDNAWSAPETDSMSSAARAILQCDLFIDTQYLKRISEEIAAAPPQERELRLKAMEALRAPCRPLEGRPEFLPLGPYVSKLFEAGRHQPYNRMLESLMDHRAPKSVREERLRIPWIHRGAYLTAWHQVLCVNYDECFTPESRTFLRRCAVHGECQFISPDVFHRIFFPTIFFGDRSDEYYRRIQAHLDRRRYDAFGLP